jgi:hypothetical protein
MILEDHDASATDLSLKGLENRQTWMPRGEFVYWYANEPDNVRPVLLAGMGLFTCMALLPKPSQWKSEMPHEITERDISAIAVATEHIVVDAFDFEGFIIWTSAEVLVDELARRVPA